MRQQPYFYHDVKDSILPSVRCDDIVDDTDFKKTLQEERDFSLVNQNSTVNGVFDYPDGVISEEHSPTAFELELRSGTLDKADISTAERLLKEQARREAKDSSDKKKKEQSDKLREARQVHLDKQVGFDSSSVQQSQ